MQRLCNSNAQRFARKVWVQVSMPTLPSRFDGLHNDAAEHKEMASRSRPRVLGAAKLFKISGILFET